MAILKLKLYITGRTPKSERAISNLKKVIQEQLAGEYELEIIDVLEKPQLAENDKILATPTLLKELPPPIRRIVGDMSETEKVLLGLDLVSCLSSEAKKEKKNER